MRAVIAFVLALVVGVGGGLGAELGRRFAKEGMAAALAARSGKTTGPLAKEINDAGGSARAYAADADDEGYVSFAHCSSPSVSPVSLTRGPLPPQERR